MKLKLDENLPASLAQSLTQLGHDVDSVVQEGLAGKDDALVRRAAQAAGRFLITQDLDFSDIRRFRPGTHAGILLVRLHEPGRLALFDSVHQAFASGDISAQEQGCFVVLTERKLRIVRPQ